MKKFILVFLLFYLAINVNVGFGQWNFDYTNPLDWTYHPVTPPANNHIIVGGGVCTIDRLPGAYVDTRIYQSLNTILGDFWTLDFDWKVTRINDLGAGGAVIPVVLTAGQQEPSNPDGRPGAHTNQDALGVICLTEWQQSDPIHIRPYLKDDSTSIETGCNIDIDLNVDYHIRLERFDNGFGRITVTRLRDNYVLGSCCFVVPATVVGLNHIQTANLVQADQFRRISAELRNTTLNEKIPVCCDLQIVGPTVICNNQTAIFCMNPDDPNSYPFSWAFSSPVIYSVGPTPNCITVTDWGHNLGVITIEATWTCNCVKKHASKTVYITDSRELERYENFEFTEVGTQNGYITPITVEASVWPLPNGVSNQWDIFRATNCLPGDLTFNNTPLRNPGTGQTWTVLTPEPGCPTCPPITTGSCYIVRHRVFYANNPECYVDTLKKLLFTKDGDTFKLTPSVNTTIADPKIYPNPASSSLTIELPQSMNGVKQIVFINTLSQVVKKIDVEQEVRSYVTSIKDLSNGLYSIKFTGGDYRKSIPFVKE